MGQMMLNKSDLRRFFQTKIFLNKMAYFSFCLNALKERQFNTAGRNFKEIKASRKELDHMGYVSPYFTQRVPKEGNSIDIFKCYPLHRKAFFDRLLGEFPGMFLSVETLLFKDGSDLSILDQRTRRFMRKTADSKNIHKCIKISYI